MNIPHKFFINNNLSDNKKNFYEKLANRYSKLIIGFTKKKSNLDDFNKKVINWLFNQDEETRMILCSIENKKYTNTFYEIYNFYINNISDNITFKIKEEDSEDKDKFKIDYNDYNFNKYFNKKEYSESKKKQKEKEYNNIHYTFLNKILFYQCESPIEDFENYSSYFTLSPDFLKDKNAFKKESNDIANNNFLKSPIQVKPDPKNKTNIIFDLPIWIQDSNDNQNYFTLAQYVLALVEQALSVRYILYNEAKNLKEILSSVYLYDLFNKKKEILSYMNSIEIETNMYYKYFKIEDINSKLFFSDNFEEFINNKKESIKKSENYSNNDDPSSSAFLEIEQIFENMVNKNKDDKSKFNMELINMCMFFHIKKLFTLDDFFLRLIFEQFNTEYNNQIQEDLLISEEKHKKKKKKRKKNKKEDSDNIEIENSNNNNDILTKTNENNSKNNNITELNSNINENINEKQANTSNINNNDKKEKYKNKEFFLYDVKEKEKKKNNINNNKADKNNEKKNHTIDNIKTKNNCKEDKKNNIINNNNLNISPEKFNKLNEDIDKFNRDIESMLKILRKIKEIIKNHFELIIKEIYPNNSKLEMYGSSLYQLDIESSDLDLSIVIHNSNISLDSLVKYLLNDKNKDLYLNVNPIYTASIPVVKLEMNYLNLNDDKINNLYESLITNNYYKICIINNYYKDFKNIKVDISLKSINYSQIDFINKAISNFPQIKPIIKILKKLLIYKNMNNSYKGGMSSYCLFLIMYSYLKIELNLDDNNYDNVSLLLGFLYYYTNYIDFNYTIINPILDNPFIISTIPLQTIPTIIDPATMNNAGKIIFRIIDVIKTLDEIKNDILLLTEGNKSNENIIYKLFNKYMEGTIK